ncbi:hypothetical protein DSL64_21350 [Dyadobacter luteus]|uniref:Uncharacterized protein n=1 Tax=Dyadobacter luteus TaxID=2259619 RepID=A0A3D8Y664_9BACT|nr:hypothetical protein [Dyadobacter luteus]REA58156.1 hypothetical protein DSL64_21350 [Dyadobacter luteus]
MLTANPWVVYASVVTPLLSAYYLAVGFIFYRHDLKAKIASWKNPPVRAADPELKPEQTKEHVTADTAEDDLAEIIEQDEDEVQEPFGDEVMMSKVEELSFHLKDAIKQAHHSGYNKEEFILLFQMTFKEYDAIYGTPFQLSVNNLIEAELEKYGSIHLSSEDRVRMWNQVD